MERLTYKKAGVDINKANKLIDVIKPIVGTTKRKGWVSNIGAFAGFFRPDIKKMKDPLLVGSTDGVGTKLVLAQTANQHNKIGIDLVAMTVNDIVCCGAEPLFFLDYFACGKLEPKVMKGVIQGIAEGCREANVALIGGETAELPGMYEDGVYDLAGFGVGIVDKSKVIDGSKVRPGDLILGIESSGIHSNGYSLVRKILKKKDYENDVVTKFLKPTYLYVKPILDLVSKIEIHGIAHITGGGFFDNIVRSMQKNTTAVIFKRSWHVPEVFNIVQERGGVPDKQMFWTFNMGIGMVLIVPKKDAWKAKRILNDKYNFKSWVIGEVIKGKQHVELIEEK